MCYHMCNEKYAIPKTKQLNMIQWNKVSREEMSYHMCNEKSTIPKTKQLNMIQ